MAAKRKFLSLDKKLKAINLLGKGSPAYKVAEEFGVGKTQIQNLLKRKCEVFEQVERNVPLDTKRRRRATGNEEINQLTYEWFKDAVALQFPDNLLGNSAKVSELIHDKVNSNESHEEQVECKICILADTSYGSCCVDEVAAQHFESDCLIHFGHSCLSQTQRLPILYIFPKQAIDTNNFISELLDLFTNESNVCIIWLNVLYHHMTETIKSLLERSEVRFIIPALDIENKQSSDVKDENGQIIRHEGRTFLLPNAISFKQCPIVYVGDDQDLSLANLVINFTENPYYTYNAANKKMEKLKFSVNRMLMRRFHLVEVAKNSEIFGILVGTLGVSNYMSIIEQIKRTLKAAGKKFYVFVLGKLNVAKLANFMEIDVYVLVACPLNSLIDSKDFYQRIITPYELEVAFNRNRPWTNQCITDYNRLLPGTDNHVALSPIEEEIFDVSLISGRIRSLGVKEKANEMDKNTESCVTIANRDSKMYTVAQIHQHGAGNFLVNRSWQGLEQKIGETEVTTTKEGRSGIPLHYQSEPDKL
ncbi:2-(3-amino-3-carboxypropyl)histidine synthase subunit 2 [Nymphon striatum]|nr:2-(3-amino-3-carboxypropyl)histidine synthase subunit 2 [Nymphon striatum]